MSRPDLAAGAHELHPSLGPVTHDGPGHRFGDSSWCGGCWWEQVGRYEPPAPRLPHADDCPGCVAAGPELGR